MIRTPHGNTLPDNPNIAHRRPRHLQITPEIATLLRDPHLIDKLQAAVHAGRLHQDDASDLLTHLRQKHRELSGARSAPGDWEGRADLPHIPMPFAPTETPHPGYTPDEHALLRTAVENAEARDIGAGLRARMAAQDPPDVRAARAQDLDAPPSLRESISASVDALTQGEPNGN